MNKNGKSKTTTTMPETKRPKVWDMQPRHREKIMDQAERENVKPSYVFSQWLAEGEKVYDKKYPVAPEPSATA